jgi:hypothetical protein
MGDILAFVTKVGLISYSITGELDFEFISYQNKLPTIKSKPLQIMFLFTYNQLHTKKELNYNFLIFTSA